MDDDVILGPLKLKKDLMKLKILLKLQKRGSKSIMWQEKDHRVSIKVSSMNLQFLIMLKIIIL